MPSAPTAEIDFQLKYYEGPSLLYKFRSATHPNCEKALCEGLLTAPDAISLNDPFDSKPEAIRQACTWEERELLLEGLKRRRFLCFSGAFTGGQDDILRWSHYGEGHRGFCLCISDAYLASQARQVTYPPDYPDLSEVRPAMEGFWDQVGFFKAPIWSYEDERRVILESGIGEYRLPPDSIWGIVFGCWSRPEERERILKAAFMHSPRCIVFQARVAPKSFGLRYQFINQDAEVKWARALAASSCPPATSPEGGDPLTRGA